MILSLLVLVIAAWGLGTLALPLYHNWYTAQLLKVPVIVCPLSRRERMWRYLRTFFDADFLVPWREVFPFLRILRSQGAFREKHGIFKDYGDVFAVVTRAGCELYIADWEVAKTILKRKKDFVKPLDFVRRLEIFDKSLAAVDGSDWSRHRRCTAAAFSETVYEAVWRTSCSEASNVLRRFLARDFVSTTQTDMTRLSFTVLLKACLGVGDDNPCAVGDSAMTESASRDLEMFFNLLSRNPESYNHSLEAANTFHGLHQRVRVFMKNLVEDRRSHFPPQKDLFTSMLASNDAELLSNEEIESNLFLFMFAGHETTANTLVYIIYLLAIFPEWQAWVLEEIDEVFAAGSLNQGASYKEHFPLFTRLKAIMYETLRLYGPVMNLYRRTTSNQDQVITNCRGSQMTISANTLINIATPALHTHPDYWGADALSWRPDRWLSNGEIDSEKIDYLFAWSEGPRACPGKRFSEIEVLAVLTTLLSQASVQLVPNLGMTKEETRSEAMGVLQSSRAILTLHIAQPEAIRVKWCPR